MRIGQVVYGVGALAPVYDSHAQAPKPTAAAVTWPRTTRPALLHQHELHIAHRLYVVIDGHG